jgi:hypothetical protein
MIDCEIVFVIVIVGFIMLKLELELLLRIIIYKLILELIWCGLIVFNAKNVLLEVTLVYAFSFSFSFPLLYICYNCFLFLYIFQS